MTYVQPYTSSPHTNADIETKEDDWGGTSLSEPHTSVTALRTCVCIMAYGSTPYVGIEFYGEWQLFATHHRTQYLHAKV